MCKVNSFGGRSTEGETPCYISTKRGMRKKRREEKERARGSLREKEREREE